MHARHASWTSRAFVIAGLLLLGWVALVAVGVVVGGDPPGWFYPVAFTLLSGGLLAAVAGLLGLYPAVRARVAWPAGLGAVLAVLGGLGALGLLGTALTGQAPWDLPGVLFRVVFFGGLGAVSASLLAFGFAVLVTAVVPRAVGALLALAPMSFLVPLAGEALGWRPDASEWVLLTAFAIPVIALLSAGLLLRDGWAREPAHDEPLRLDRS